MPQMWHQPPQIVPNYGRKKHVAQRTSVTRVLLHDNVSQQQMLDSKLSLLSMEQRRISKLLELHRKSFIVQQSIKQQHLRSIGINHISYLPDIMVHDAVGYRSSGDERPHTTAVTGTSNHVNTSTNRRRVPKSPRKFPNTTDGTAQNTGSKSAVSISNGQTTLTPRSLSILGASKNSERQVLEANGHSNGHVNRRGINRSYSAITSGELEKDLSKFSTTNYVLVKEVINEDGSVDHQSPMSSRINGQDVTETFDSSRKGSQNSSPVSKSSSGRLTKRPYYRQASCDPRFQGLERSLIRTEYPVGGYTTLSASGNSILQQCGAPLYDYEQLRGLIDHYNSMPTPRRKPSEDLANDDDDGEGIDMGKDRMRGGIVKKVEFMEQVLSDDEEICDDDIDK